MQKLNEDAINKNIERSAEAYAKRYRAQMESLTHSPLAVVRGLSMFDYFALGEQLNQFDEYKNYMMEEGSAADLGKLPDIAYDLITTVYGTSIIPICASVQPIDEERGTIYFKQVRASNTRGNVTAGDILRNPTTATGLVYPQGYAGERVTQSLFTTVGGTLVYAGVTSSTPVRPNTVRIAVATLGFTMMDDGTGNLLGMGCQGVINYTTGAYTITFAANPAGAFVVSAQYATNFEESGVVPKITSTLANDSIEAQIFALTSEIGLFKSFALRKRFGKSAEDELIADLTGEINSEIGHTALAQLNAVAVGNVNWNRIPGTGVSYFEHKQELKDVIARAESTILTNAGRGVVNLLIAGAEASGYLSNLPGFEKVSVNATGPQLYGTLDGVPVIRTPMAVPTAQLLAVFKGPGNFEAPLVYSPYMPLFVTNNLQAPGNILKKQGVVAVWAGMKAVIPNFVTRITITNNP